MNKFILILFVIVIIGASNFPAASRAQQYSLNIQFSPNQANLKINEEKIVKMTLTDTGGISGFDLKFQTSGLLQITDFVDTLSFDNDFNQFNARRVIENIQGSSSHLAFVFTAPSNNLPKTVEIFIKIKGSVSGQGAIELDYNNSQVLNGKGQIFRLTPALAAYDLSSTQSSPTFIDPSSISSGYPDTAAIVNLKLRLYGVQAPTQKIKAIAVAVGRVGEGKFETQPQGFDLIPSEDGTFQGTVALPNFQDGNKYSLMLKVDKYLLRRLCDGIPTETKVGGYRCVEPSLTIRQGENSFDFSGISLLPGDLGLADGVLNGYDLSLVRNNLGNNGAASTADLNYDGLVDTKDFEIIQDIATNTTAKADQ